MRAAARVDMPQLGEATISPPAPGKPVSPLRVRRGAPSQPNGETPPDSVISTSNDTGNGDVRASELGRGVAVLGCGYWGVNYVRVLNELVGASVAVVCDAAEERLRAVAARFPGVRLARDVESALAVEGVEAAVIATPARTHHAVARMCLERKKHVLVEKPLTTTTDQADDLVRLAKRHRRTLMVGHTFIYNPGVQKMKEYIVDKRIGKIYYLYSRRTNLGPIRHDVNALWDLAAHDIAIFNYLLDSTPEWVSATGSRVLRNGREDVGFVCLSYPDGTLGHLHVSWADPNKVREVVVVGSDRRIVFNDLDAVERVRVFEKGVAPSNGDVHEPYGFIIRDGDITSPAVENAEPLKVQCAHFLRCLDDGGRPLTGGREGREVVRVMEAIDRSLTRNGAPVALA